MKPSIYGPFPCLPITRRTRFRWPGGARIAIWVIPNLEFFHLDDPLPGAANERIPPAHAKIPNVHSWGMREYGNRVGFFRLIECMSRHGIRGTAATNSEICDYNPQIMEAAVSAGWEFMGHCETNAMRLNEMDPYVEKQSIHKTLDRIGKAAGTKTVGWLGAGLAETWNTLDFMIDEGVRYIADWTCDDLPFRMNVSGREIFSIPYSLHVNDTAQFFNQKVSAKGFGEVIRKQFDCLYREAADIPRVMAIALHPFVSGVPYRIAAVDEAFAYIKKHPEVWFATGSEIIDHYASIKGSE